MIKSKSDLLFYIQEDKVRNLGKISWNKYILCSFVKSEHYIAFHYLKNLRKYEYAINCKSGIIGIFMRLYYRWKWHRLSLKYNISIGPNMVGYGFKIPHVIGGGIMINCISMGNYCGANLNVLVGNNGSQENRPIIGNNVKLLTGCKIYGRISVGDNVVVAPNAVVCKDVSHNCVVGGIPFKVLRRL